MKRNKLIVAVSPDPVVRAQIMRHILVDLKFAYTHVDAGKLIRPSVYDFDLDNAYYVCADNFKFSESNFINQRLYELAARGIAVILGTKNIPARYEFLCDAIYP